MSRRCFAAKLGLKLRKLDWAMRAPCLGAVSLFKLNSRRGVDSGNLANDFRRPIFLRETCGQGGDGKRSPSPRAGIGLFWLRAQVIASLAFRQDPLH